MKNWKEYIELRDRDVMDVYVELNVADTPKNQEICRTIRRELSGMQLKQWVKDAIKKAAELPLFREDWDKEIGYEVDTMNFERKEWTVSRPERKFIHMGNRLYLPIKEITQYFETKDLKFDDWPEEQEVPLDGGFIIGPCRYKVVEDPDNGSYNKYAEDNPKDVEPVEYFTRIRVRTAGLSFFFNYRDGKMLDRPVKMATHQINGAGIRAHTDSNGMPMTEEMYEKSLTYMAANQEEIIKRADMKPLNSSLIGESAQVRLSLVVYNEKCEGWMDATASEMANPDKRCAISAAILGNTYIIENDDPMASTERVRIVSCFSDKPVHSTIGKAKCEFVVAKIKAALSDKDKTKKLGDNKS